MPSPYTTDFIPSPYATEFMPRSANFLQQIDEQGQAPGQDLAFVNQFATIRELSGQERRDQGQEAAFRPQVPNFAQQGPAMLPPQNFAQQGPAMLPPPNFAQQGPAMLPPFASAPMGNYMLMPLQPSAEVLRQAGLPYITPYEPPKPAMPTLMPPMGEFTPPKLRKMMQEMEMPEKMTTGGMAKLGALYGIDEHVIIDDDDDDDDDDDKDGDYNPKQEGWKKKQKKQQMKQQMKQQTKQPTKKATAKSKQRIRWTRKGDSVPQGGQEAMTMTATPATMTAPTMTAPTMTAPTMTAPTMTAPTTTVPTTTTATTTAPPNMIAPRPLSAPPAISAPTTTTTETPAMARLSTDSETQDEIEEDVKMAEG